VDDDPNWTFEDEFEWTDEKKRSEERKLERLKEKLYRKKRGVMECGAVHEEDEDEAKPFSS
jgi:hypothetical protein